LIEDIPRHPEENFSKSGIATFHGRAHFVAPAAIQVGNDVLEGANVVVAAGSRPADLTIPGAEYAVPSEQFLELEKLPGRILLIGGGFMSFEFTHVAARARVGATISHRGRPLERFDPDSVDRLVGRTRDLGIDVQLGTEVISVN
jgi:glutathione reductase (NADPH)